MKGLLILIFIFFISGCGYKADPYYPKDTNTTIKQ